eukprot:g21302.t1
MLSLPFPVVPHQEWCKFDLEWALYKERFEVADKSMSDSKWYPDGVPLAYLSMHNTKQFEVTDWLLSWLARCVKFKPTCKDKGRAPAQNCQEDSSAERQLRRKPGEYLHHMCCCVEPRMEKWIFWGKTWFSRSADESEPAEWVAQTPTFGERAKASLGTAPQSPEETRRALRRVLPMCRRVEGRGKREKAKAEVLSSSPVEEQMLRLGCS